MTIITLFSLVNSLSYKSKNIRLFIIVAKKNKSI
jgi:hypothetical protein